MLISREQRLEKYRSSTEEIQDLYSLPEHGDLLRKIFEASGLKDDQYKNYATTIGDVILGFYAKTQLAELLQKNLGIPRVVAEKIAGELKEFLSPIPDIAEIHDKESSDLINAPAPQPAILVKKESIIGARTMQSDIATLKKEEERKPFIAGAPATTSSTPLSPIPAAAPAPTKPPLTPPPLVRGSVPETPASDPTPRYAKPMTEMPRYTNLK